jgi:glycosyltransferase involved in cell wall biosynthesis
MIIICIMNGIVAEKSSQPNISGGDVRCIEIAKRWCTMGHEVHLVTTAPGVELCRKLGLNAAFHEFRVRSDYSRLAAAQKIIYAKQAVRGLEGLNALIYSSTELWYDVLPGVILKKKRPGATFGVVAHWVAPLKRTGTTSLNAALFFINSRMGLYYCRRYADVVLAVSEPTRRSLMNLGMPPERIHPVACGVDHHSIRRIASETKKVFDAVFMKRFDATKGVFDVLEIWKQVSQEMPDARLLMVGHGSRAVMTRMSHMIERFGLEANVKIVGPVYDFHQKISLLASSRLLLLPSYEENWAIVVGEALAAGTVALCYALPELQSVWGEHVVWIPVGDKRAFATTVLELLHDDTRRASLSQAGRLLMECYDWETIARRELLLLTGSAREESRVRKKESLGAQ